MIINTIDKLKTYVERKYEDCNSFVIHPEEKLVAKDLSFEVDCLCYNTLNKKCIYVEFYNIEFKDCYFRHDKNINIYFNNCNFYHCCFFDEIIKESINVDYDTCDFNNCIIGQNAVVINMINCNFDFSNTWRDRYRNNTDFSNTYMFHPSEYLDEFYEKTKEGYIVYKVFNLYYKAPERWKIEPNSIITEAVNFNMEYKCASGINVSTLEWIKNESIFHPNREFEVWKCLIRYEWSMGICVPYNTNGCFRCGKLQLLESRRFTGVKDLRNNIETAFNQR